MIFDVNGDNNEIPKVDEDVYLKKFNNHIDVLNKCKFFLLSFLVSAIKLCNMNDAKVS